MNPLMALPNICPQAPHPIRTVEALDADEHAHNLTDWEQSYDQMTSGHFRGVLAEIQLPQLQVFRECTSQGVRQSCCVWPDAIWFGLPDHDAPLRINGRLAGMDTVLVRPGNCDFELLTPANYAIYGIVIRQESLLRAADQMGCQLNWAQLTSSERMHVNDRARAACLQTLSALLTEEGTHASHGVAVQAVVESLLSMLDTRAVDRAVSNSFARRKGIVAKARQHVLDHHDEVITVPELCERLHVSRRTLQYCFEEVLGMSPIQYLRIIRLNGARRDLRENVAHCKTVRDVAADWGFWHFSQFSSDYRALFGQTPSESLRQRTH